MTTSDIKPKMFILSPAGYLTFTKNKKEKKEKNPNKQQKKVSSVPYRFPQVLPLGSPYLSLTNKPNFTSKTSPTVMGVILK